MTTGPSMAAASPGMLRPWTPRRRSRRRISTALALVLAVESVSAVSVAAIRPVGPCRRRGARPPGRSSPSARSLAASPFVVAPVRPFRRSPCGSSSRSTGRTPAAEADRPAAAPPKPAREAVPQRRAEGPGRRQGRRKPAAAPKPSTHAAPPPRSHRRKPRPQARQRARPGYSGTNHVWIPSLGISRSVAVLPVRADQREPDNYMYRWGCAGANNVYLMGHAHSVMKPLHDAYVSGRLNEGMKAFYADSNGRVHEYTVKWWKVTRPTTDAAWAWAAAGRAVDDAPDLRRQEQRVPAHGPARARSARPPPGRPRGPRPPSPAARPGSC